VTYLTPTRRDHEKFCTREGWSLVRSSRGKKVGHHLTYELALPDGRILRTRISHPPDRSTYGRSLWGHILGDQLDVTEDAFWNCVTINVLPTRSTIAIAPTDALPLDLVHQLINAHQVPEDEVAAMSKEQALERLQEFWANPPEEPD